MFVVIWRGAGILAVLIPVGALVAGWLGLEYGLGEAWTKRHPGFVGAISFLSGVVVWFLGRKLNGHFEKKLTDQLTQEKTISNNRHTLFFIPMEYTAIFWCLVGAFLFFNLKGGVPQDEAQTVAQYRNAAEQGDAKSQFNLGVRYEQGSGIIKDETQAADWYRKAVEQGLADAQFNLGVMYLQGRGVAKDETQAFALFRKAAEQGHVNSQNNLGFMYANGRGVAQDDAQAVVWFRKAAEHGSVDAQQTLDAMKASGRGNLK
ncbi:MAG: sel1 repeat family protein [Desulfobulbaceae bacterium]|jgi:hypothetical protein|nr:sel1 repeat family protein [Desulfobulbaceae bacterium]